MSLLQSDSATRHKWAVCLLLTFLGASTAVVSLSEELGREFAAFGVQGWMSLLVLPFAAGLAIALGILDRPQDSASGKVWTRRAVRAILILGAVLGFAAGYLDVLFEAENRNNVFGGLFMTGFATALALKWVPDPNQRRLDAVNPGKSRHQPAQRS